MALLAFTQYWGEFIYIKISRIDHVAQLAIISEKARSCCCLRQAFKSKLFYMAGEVLLMQSPLSNQVTV